MRRGMKGDLVTTLSREFGYVVACLGRFKGEVKHQVTIVKPVVDQGIC